MWLRAISGEPSDAVHNRGERMPLIAHGYCVRHEPSNLTLLSKNPASWEILEREALAAS